MQPEFPFEFLSFFGRHHRGPHPEHGFPHPHGDPGFPPRRGEHGGRGFGPGGGHGRGPFGGPRTRRGEARFILLDALREGPRHGYEIIKYLEERSSGAYAPSPGTVYPTMQYLEDMGLVRSEQNADRRVYHLTDAGRAELTARTEELNAFWSRFSRASESAALQTEIEFLAEELQALERTAWSGLRSIRDGGDPEMVRRIRQAVERCRGEVRDIIAERAAQSGNV